MRLPRKRSLSFVKSVVFLPLFIMFIISASAYGSDLMDRGIKEFRAENFEEALIIFKQARQEEPNNSVAAFYLGLAYKQGGQNKEAVENFKAAVTLTPAVKDAYPELVEILYNANEFKEARKWIAKAEKENILPARMVFLSGLILVKENKNSAAIDAFKKAKQLDTSMSQAADFQIAMAYAKEKKPAEAQEAFKAVIAVDPNSELASFAKEYEMAVTEAVAKFKVWRFNVGLSYNYDDNIVSKPSTSVPGVLIFGEKGYYGVGTFSVNYNPAPWGPLSLSAAYGLYSSHYRDTNTHNIMSHTVSATPGYTYQSVALTVPVSYNYVFLRERGYESVTAVKPTFTLLLSPTNIVQAGAGLAKRDIIKEAIDPNENRDGKVYSALLGYIHPFTNGAMANFRYEYTKDITDGQNWKNRGNEFNLGGVYPLTQKLSLLGNAGYLQQDYDKTSTVFLLRRHDKIYTASATAKTEVYKNLNVNLSYGWTRADSNIAVYDYKRNVYTAGLDYSF